MTELDRATPEAEGIKALRQLGQRWRRTLILTSAAPFVLFLALTLSSRSLVSAGDAAVAENVELERAAEKPWDDARVGRLPKPESPVEAVEALTEQLGEIKTRIDSLGESRELREAIPEDATPSEAVAALVSLLGHQSTTDEVALSDSCGIATGPGQFAIYYATGRAELTLTGEAVTRYHILRLGADGSDAVVEGYADPVPPLSRRTNQELSEARSEALASYLRKIGVRARPIGQGEALPPGLTSENRFTCRRSAVVTIHEGEGT